MIVGVRSGFARGARQHTGMGIICGSLPTATQTGPAQGKLNRVVLFERASRQPTAWIEQGGSTHGYTRLITGTLIQIYVSPAAPGAWVARGKLTRGFPSEGPLDSPRRVLRGGPAHVLTRLHTATRFKCMFQTHAPAPAAPGAWPARAKLTCGVLFERASWTAHGVVCEGPRLGVHLRTDGPPLQIHAAPQQRQVRGLRGGS